MNSIPDDVLCEYHATSRYGLHILHAPIALFYPYVDHPMAYRLHYLVDNTNIQYQTSQTDNKLPILQILINDQCLE